MRLSLVLVSLALGIAVVLPGLAHHASADDTTPTIPADTPVVTVVSPTVVPEATLPPTVTRERSTPVITVLSTVPAVPTNTAVPEVTATPAGGLAGTPTPVPALAPAGTAVPPSVYWPTPAQLRENARLRWGGGIPADVRRWAFLIVPAARRYGLDPNLIAAVMTMESGGDPLALSSADARGLMQILHGPWDPKTNIDLGAHMLSDLHAQFGDWRLALAAYNAGPAAVTSYGGVPPYRETRDYVIIVTYLWDLFSHHHLSFHRRALYRASLRDLQGFADQRKKVKRLAHVAHVAPPPAPRCPIRLCGANVALPAPAVGDPFWPLSGSPDPLQHVDPPSAQA